MPRFALLSVSDKTGLPAFGQALVDAGYTLLSTGGTAIDLTDVVHPDNREMAVRAAQAIGLDVAGVDFITPDITRSYRDVGGAICEVNAAPAFACTSPPLRARPETSPGR